jgi:hypothetical protein
MTGTELLPNAAEVEPTGLQRAFLDRLQTLHDSSVAPMPDFAAALTHDGRLGSGINVHDLNGAYLTRQELAPYAAAGEVTPNTFSFDLQPLVGMGREESWRQVFFGRMDLTSRSGNVETDVQTAVKAFPLSESAYALREAGMMQYLAEQGISTVELVSFIVDREAGMFYLVTRFDGAITPLNKQKFWLNIQSEGLDAQLQPAVQMLADLQGELVFHGDAEFKNAGIGEQAGSYVAIDLERAVSMRDLVDGDEPPQRVIEAMAADFASIRKSFQTTVYPNLPPDQAPQTPEQQLDYELKHFFEPYIRAVRAGDSPHKTMLVRAYEGWVERRRKELVEG